MTHEVRPLAGLITTLAVALGACGGPSPSMTAGPESSAATARASGAPSPSASSGADAEGYRVVWVPESGVRTVPLEANFRSHRLDSAGPLVVLDELQPGDTPTNARAIILVDLQAGSWRQLDEAAPGYQPWDPRISGRTVVWVEWHYEGPNNTGLADWRIRVQQVDEAHAATVASGVQRRTLQAYGASMPVAAIDGDLVAYAVEDPTRPPDGWRIVVWSLSRQTVVRTILSDQSVYDLSIWHGTIAYTVGRVDPKLGFTYDTRLLVSSPDSPTPRQLATNAFEVRLRDGRIAWSQDAPTIVTGAAVGTRIWTAALADLRPLVVSPPVGQGIEQRQAWPSTGEGLVAWASFRLDIGHADNDGERLCLWSPGTILPVEVRPPLGAILSGIADGWVVWTNDRPDVETISGIPLGSIPLS